MSELFNQLKPHRPMDGAIRLREGVLDSAWLKVISSGRTMDATVIEEMDAEYFADNPAATDHAAIAAAALATSIQSPTMPESPVDTYPMPEETILSGDDQQVPGYLEDYPAADQQQIPDQPAYDTQDQRSSYELPA